ncbi:MAG: YopX family protein [Blautia sp.]|nr:YopX family protein [Blautia sp.]
MNRENLFKAKRIDNGEWVEGYYVYCRKRHYILPVLNKAIGFDEREDEWVEVDPDTLCQYTGLIDKHGRKIWENDICDRKEKYPEIVTYNEGDWQLDYSYVFGKEIHHDACNLGFYACERNCVEVVGNIFDDPELLEVE